MNISERVQYLLSILEIETDTSFIDYNNSKCESSCEFNMEKDTILLSIDKLMLEEYKTKNHEIEDQIQTALQILLNQGYKIIVIPSSEEDLEYCRQYIYIFQDENITVTNYSNNISSLIKLIQNSILSINLDMKTGIICAALEKPFVSFFKAEKFQELLNKFDLKLELDLDNFNAGNLIEKVKEIVSSASEVNKKLSMLFKEFENSKNIQIELDNYKYYIKTKIEELINFGKVEEAKSLFTKYEEILPDDLENYSIKGVIAIAEGNIDYAEEILLEGLQKDTHNFDILYNLGYLYEVKEEFDKSFYYYKMAKDNCKEPGLVEGVENILDRINNEYIHYKLINDNKATKKALVIAHIFPPLGGSGVQRTLKFVKYLRDYGWEPIVVTVGKTAFPYIFDENLLKELPKNIEIIRVDEENTLNMNSINELVELYSKIVNDERLMSQFTNEINEGSEKLQSLILMPDVWTIWVNNVLKSVDKYVDFKEIDLIYSTAGPNSAHLAGYFLKHKYNKPWVADFRDEWTNNPYRNYDKSSLRYKIEHAMESSIVKSADKIITISSIAVENYRKNFKLKEEKVIEITNGYDEEDFKSITQLNKKNNKFTIMHNGMLYMIRTPETFLKALSNLIRRDLIDREKIKVIFTFTENSEHWINYSINLGLEGIIEILPYVGHEESLKRAARVDALLLVVGPGEKNKSVYTGKVFEYLRLNKPILSLAPVGGVVDRLIKETGRGYNVDFDDISGIEKYLLKLYKEWENDSLCNFEVDNKVKKYDRQELTKKLSEIFNDITNQEKQAAKRKRVAFFMIEKGDSFINDIIESLGKQFETKKIIVKDYKQIDEGMKWADICWFEWCDMLIEYGSRHQLANTRKIICRLHSYEVFTDYPGKVNWNTVDKVIFVAEHIRETALEKFKIDKNKTCVIPNGININKYSYRSRNKGFNIAYVGYIDYKKSPLLLFHTFKAIYDRDSRYKLYIAGNFTDERYVLYFKQMVKELGLENNMFYEGWKDNINDWLEDKDYILCTSVLESQNLSVMQAMAKGIKPLVHNFVGARNIYLDEYIWNTIDEAVHMVTEDNYTSIEYRSFIEKNYSFDEKIKLIKEQLNDLYIENVNIKTEQKKIRLNDIDEIVSINYYGRSGAFFLQSLLDSHPSVLMLPGDYLRFYCEFWNFIQQKYENVIDNEILINEFCYAFPYVFDATANSPLFRNTYVEYGGAFGIPLNFHYMGDNCNESLGVNKHRFIQELREVLVEKTTIDRKDFFIAIHIAYYHTLGRQYNANDKLKIVFNPHKYDPNNYIDFLKEFKTYKRICMVREPVQSFGSNIKLYLKSGLNISQALTIIESMLVGGLCKTTDCNICAVKLEELHKNPKHTLLKLCKFLEIKWDDILLESTFDGLKWWNKNNSDKINGFSEKIISKKHEEIFSEFDKQRLSNILKDKYIAWDYSIDVPMSEKDIIKEIEKPFKFEKFIQYSSEEDAQKGKILIRELFIEYLKLRRENKNVQEINLLKE